MITEADYYAAMARIRELREVYRAVKPPEAIADEMVRLIDQTRDWEVHRYYVQVQRPQTLAGRKQ